jgi:hypothetical protein
MSQTYFSKLDPKEKESRLLQLGSSKGEVTVWVKGQKLKHKFSVIQFDFKRNEIILETNEEKFSAGTSLLCSFDLRGLSFFCEVISNRSLMGHFILETKKDLYKSEKRSSYRLLTFPIYEVYAEFDLGKSYEEGKIIDIRTRTSQTGLFKSFLKLVENKDDENQHQRVKYRVQDLSAGGMSLQISELEADLFVKDFIFTNVVIQFRDESIVVPEVKVVYLVDYIAGDKNLKKYKVGLHFTNLPAIIDDQLGGKINKLLREIDFNKDFENFTR